MRTPRFVSIVILAAAISTAVAGAHDSMSHAAAPASESSANTPQSEQERDEGDKNSPPKCCDIPKITVKETILKICEADPQKKVIRAFERARRRLRRKCDRSGIVERCREGRECPKEKPYCVPDYRVLWGETRMEILPEACPKKKPGFRYTLSASCGPCFCWYFNESPYRRH